MAVAIGSDLGPQILKALNMEGAMVRRIVVDLQVGHAAVVYTDGFADRAMEDLKWPEILEGAKVNPPTMEDLKWPEILPPTLGHDDGE